METDESIFTFAVLFAVIWKPKMGDFMSAGWKVAVLIPARNEEVLLGRCLESVIRAIDTLPVTTTATIVLVSDCSTDRTAEIGYSLIGDHGTVLHTGSGTVGTARALAASFAISKTTAPLSKFWLANTDADCIVPPSWLSEQIDFAASGIEAVAGVISVDSFEEHGSEVPARFHSSYLVRADGTHPHVHGANLGVRADRYLEVGGWADLRTAEDHDLWGRRRRIGVRLRSCAQLQVVTSGRRVGRAPCGFADALAAHNNTVLAG
jgi:glycosyltransferase involved in cell wall biosynthesis